MEELFYSSTRGGETGVTASMAILKGLAGDGGLFMPEKIPALPVSLRELAGMTYQETAYAVMKEFLTDFTETELKDCIARAYDEKFDTAEIAPVTKAEGNYYLELFHGKTIAFKDMALSILPHLMTAAARKNGEDKEILILTATSGDTGKAAMAGFADVPGTKIMVFYPKDGVSRIQELQMLTQEGENTAVVGLYGNFDDAQTGVKQIFEDKVLEKELADMGIRLSSANSINIGRLVPQIVYYVYAYGRLLKEGEIEEGEEINVSVPTGNFGNILAAYFAKQMGIPYGTLICASNDNKVLYDFFTSGTYDKNREFFLTTSPSMDILVSSNLERLLYLSCGRDAKKTKALMESLKETGRYEITPDMREFMGDFAAGFAVMDECAEEIRWVYEDTGYVLDPHTAVAAAVTEKYESRTGDYRKTVIVSTASPYKFAETVVKAIGGEKDGCEGFPAVDALHEMSGLAVPKAVEELRRAPVRHTKTCRPEEMTETVKFAFQTGKNEI